jgi:HSP20 family molecular chaperone IbpA
MQLRDLTAPERKGGKSMSTDSTQTNKKVDKKSTIVGAITLVAGIFIGLIAMRYVGGHATAMAATKAPRAPAAAAAVKHEGPVQWNPFQEIRDMQSNMDQVFDAMTAQFRMQPRMDLFADNPGYSLSLHVQDLKDRFEVRAYLPNAKASDVKVTLPNNQTLKVDVSNKNTETTGETSGESTGSKNASTSVTEWGQYEQTIQLPAAVKSEQMKIDHQKHELLITLPKA